MVLDHSGSSITMVRSFPLPCTRRFLKIAFTRIGPEKGVISLAMGSVTNALWDMYARARGKPLWQLSKLSAHIDTEWTVRWSACIVCDFTPEEFVQSTAFRYISDAITKEEALEMLKSRESSKKERTQTVLQQGYPAYTTSVGCKYSCPLSPVLHW